MSEERFLFTSQVRKCEVFDQNVSVFALGKPCSIHHFIAMRWYDLDHLASSDRSI